MSNIYSQISSIETHVNSEYNSFKKNYLSKHAVLPVSENITSTNSVLFEVWSEYQDGWRKVFDTAEFFVESFGYSTDAIPQFYHIDAYAEFVNFIDKMDEYYTPAFNNGVAAAKPQVSSPSRDVYIFTNNAASLLAYGLILSVSKSLDDVARDNQYRNNRRALVQRLNAIWKSNYDSFKSLFVKQGELIIRELMAGIYETFGCTEEEYLRNKNTGSIQTKRSMDAAIAQVSNEISFLEQRINAAGSFPFGQKAKQKQADQAQLSNLKKELIVLKNPPKIEGIRASLRTFNMGYYRYSIKKTPGTQQKIFCRFFREKYAYQVFCEENNLYVGDLSQGLTTKIGRGRKLNGIISNGMYTGMTPDGLPMKVEMEVTLYELL